MSGCDAINKAEKRCKGTISTTYPCVAVFDARITSYKATKFKAVCLCEVHSRKADALRDKNLRLKLHHGGWFGAYNQYKYGNLVIDRATVNWETVKVLHVPKYWSKD